MHITSLPSPYGIGTFGAEAEKFVDWLKNARQKYWQVLPVGPTGYGDSPYQSFSTFAGNPLLIDLDDLVQNGFLTKKKCEDADFGADPSFVDFEKVTRTKMALLDEAFHNFKEDVGYVAFIQSEAVWLDDYSLFMAIKEKFNNVSWLYWDQPLKFRAPDALKSIRVELADRVNFWKFVQYTFYRQWDKLRRYANRNDVQIIGDIPIYVSMDSADVWANTDLFLLDDDLNPTAVAGVPPDYFSATGQLWGNPLYDWEKMKSEKYIWWISRIKKAMQIYDVLRIDHFRAFDTYCSIPAGEDTAINGKWINGPGMLLWNEVKAQLGDVNIIAEDLGEIFDSVKQLMKDSGFPGMRVLQFGFNSDNSDNDHLPHRYPQNCVAYTGTHDNCTVMQWYKESDKAAQAMAKRYVNPNLFEPLNWAMIRSLYQSTAGLVIVPMQDILGLGAEARMNIPSTLGGNWIWRMKPTAKKEKYTQRLADLAYTYFR